MTFHQITETDVRIALDEIVCREHVLASARASIGGTKRLTYNPQTSTYRIKTAEYEATCKTAAEAARLYSDH